MKLQCAFIYLPVLLFSIIGCSSVPKETKDFYQANSIGTAESYSSFLKKYPDGGWADYAKHHIKEIERAAIVKQRFEMGIVDTYNKYVKSEPYSRYGIVKNISRWSLQMLSEAADSGLTEAQYLYATMLTYRFTRELRELHDHSLAIEYYKMAADSGDMNAVCCIARMYENGDGVDTDRVEAMNLYKVAAENGNLGAMVAIGNYYSNKSYYDVVTKDPSVAYAWYRRAADAGNTAAMELIAFMYKNGEGVSKSKSDYLKWYNKAADSGSIGAAFNLGKEFESGEYLVKNENAAVLWYRIAAEAGHPTAKERLASLNTKYAFNAFLSIVDTMLAVNEKMAVEKERELIERRERIRNSGNPVCPDCEGEGQEIKTVQGHCYGCGQDSPGYDYNCSGCYGIIPYIEEIVECELCRGKGYL